MAFGERWVEDLDIAALKKELAGFKVPKRVWFLDDLPRNTMGKIRKKSLREQFAAAFG